MTREEAEAKADQAIEMELIERDQFDAYVQHLLETHNQINKDVDRGTAIPTDSSTDKE